MLAHSHACSHSVTLHNRAPPCQLCLSSEPAAGCLREAHPSQTCVHAHAWSLPPPPPSPSRPPQKGVQVGGVLGLGVVAPIVLATHKYKVRVPFPGRMEGCMAGRPGRAAGLGPRSVGRR